MEGKARGPLGGTETLAELVPMVVVETSPVATSWLPNGNPMAQKSKYSVSVSGACRPILEGRVVSGVAPPPNSEMSQIPSLEGGGFYNTFLVSASVAGRFFCVLKASKRPGPFNAIQRLVRGNGKADLVLAPHHGVNDF